MISVRTDEEFESVSEVTGPVREIYNIYADLTTFNNKPSDV